MAKADNVISFPGGCQKQPGSTKSLYELYPLPFFAAKTHSTWAVEPTGDYSKDCATGTAYALEFLKSCDGTLGWSSLLARIVGDMIRAGPTGTFADGHPRINGIAVGFMNTIGKDLVDRRARQIR